MSGQSASLSGSREAYRPDAGGSRTSRPGGGLPSNDIDDNVLVKFLFNQYVRAYLYRFKASCVLFIESTMYIVPQCIVPQNFLKLNLT